MSVVPKWIENRKNIDQKIFLTYWYFEVKAIFFRVNYIHGTRIPSDYPEYMFINMNPDGPPAKYLSVEEQLKQLKEIYKDDIINDEGTR